MANQVNSLAWNVEQWIIDVLYAGTVIPGDFSIEHYDETDRADRNRIVIRATVGARDFGGSRPWNVAAEIERVSVSIPEATAELYDAYIDDLIDPDNTPFVASIAKFEDLIPLSQEDEQKEASNNTRRRSRTFNFLALESTAAFTYFRPDGLSHYFRPDGTSQYLRPAA